MTTDVLLVVWGLACANCVIRARPIARGFRELAERLPDYPLWRVVSAVVGTPWQVRLVGASIGATQLLLFTGHVAVGLYVSEITFPVITVASWRRYRQLG